jgi:hypothetical protein
MAQGTRKHSWILIGGTISAVAILVFLCWPFVVMLWSFLNGYDVHVHDMYFSSP